MTKRRWWLPSIRGLLIGTVLAAAPAIYLGARAVDAVRERRSESIDRPDILLTLPEVFSITYPDPVHLALADGRKFRLAHVVAPLAGTAEYAAASEQVWKPLNNGGSRQRGLRTVGTNAQGETLVEMWGFEPSIGGCGNSSWSERRAASIPHWKDLTWQLLNSGNYRLEPGETDPELIGWQEAAKSARTGMWGKADVLREVLDLRRLEQTLELTTPADQPKPRETRLQAAGLLLRADAAVYAPRVLKIVRDEGERNVYFRCDLAQLLEEAGHVEGTDYLMIALANEGRNTKMKEIDLNGVVSDYVSFWNVQPYTVSHRDVVAYYLRVIRPKFAAATTAPAR